jgi:putative transposase
LPRAKRNCPANIVVHIINRANDRRRLFSQTDDYNEFLELLKTGSERVPVRICGFCLMPNHWHLVLWPTTEGDISGFMHWISSVHAMRVRRRWNAVGSGHVYQDRFKSLPVETGLYYYNVMKYVEANALRAGLVTRAEDWQWSSLFDRVSETPRIALGNPIELPADWPSRVNDGVSAEDLEALRDSAEAGRPYGSPGWLAAHRCRRRRTRRADLAP